MRRIDGMGATGDGRTDTRVVGVARRWSLGASLEEDTRGRPGAFIAVRPQIAPTNTGRWSRGERGRDWG
jgi:hypothetical protein